MSDCNHLQVFNQVAKESILDIAIITGQEPHILPSIKNPLLCKLFKAVGLTLCHIDMGKKIKINKNKQVILVHGFSNEFLIFTYCFSLFTTKNVYILTHHNIQQAFDVLKAKADVVVVEGAGGFRVPINRQETMADLAVKLNLPIILVVGVRLGCINHALMTAGSIRAAGLNLVGWVANRIDPNMPAIEENIATLKAMLKAPCIADVAWGEEPQFIDF
jgi:hypothetical protein